MNQVKAESAEEELAHEARIFPLGFGNGPFVGNVSTKPLALTVSASCQGLRSAVTPSGEYTQPRLTSTAVSLPLRNSGVRILTPGDPLRPRSVKTICCA